MEQQNQEQRPPSPDDGVAPKPAEPKIQNPPGANCAKVKSIMGDVLSKLDFFKATTYLCLEGKPTSSSMFGGIITLIVCFSSFNMSGWPFKDNYISSVNLMDDIVYNYTGLKHPLAINITLPPDSPPLLNNITVELGCRYSNSDILIYLFQSFAERCQMGDFCAPLDFECPLYTSLDKEVSALMFSVYLCESSFTPGCDTSLIESIDYVNITISYYSDQVSFTEPKFNRYLVTRNISIPTRSSGSIEEELEVNFFNTNTYIKGIFGFEAEKLSSLRYSQSYSTLTVVQPAFMGLFEGDSLFSYALTTKQSSKQITNHFPSISAWISEVISFTSIVTLIIGFVFGYYETNIMILKLMSYLKYAIQKNGKPTNFREESLKTIAAGYLYHDWILKILPNCILNYFYNHFKALEEGHKMIKLQNVLNQIASISIEKDQIIKVDLDQQDDEQEQDEEQTDYFSPNIEKNMKQYIKQNYQYRISEIEQGVFLSFTKIQNYNLKQSIMTFEIMFGQRQYVNDAEYEHLRNEYYVFRAEAYPDYPLEVSFLNEEDIKTISLEEFRGSNQDIVVRISHAGPGSAEQ